LILARYFALLLPLWDASAKMRTFTLLSVIALVAASDLEKQGDCVVDGAEAVSDLMDSTMFIWASIQRCGDHPGVGGHEVKC